MTESERGVLLLCSTLDEQAARPLSMAEFRALSARACSFGAPGSDPLCALTASDVARLGYSEEEAARIAALLSRTERLDRMLARMEGFDIFPVTRLSPGYPPRLKRAKGRSCPPVLWCAGKEELLGAPAVSLVGSRKLGPTGRAFAERIGRLAAAEGFALVSGGAGGADTAAEDACRAVGGSVLLFLADSLLARCRDGVPANTLLCSAFGPAQPFSAARAAERNSLIHIQGEKVFVAQTDYGTGGTWGGTVQNLKKQWTPVFVCDDGSEGARGLIERGASSLSPPGPTSLRTLRAEQAQQSLF